VSVTQAPWLQYWPAAHAPASAVQEAAHEPSTQYGVGAEQLALVVHVVAEGKHAPPEQVVVAAQAVAGQPTTHWPLAHTFPVPQSLVYTQVSIGGVQTLPAQTLPPVQSLLAAQGQGPFVPPQVMHWLCQHSWEAPVHWVLAVQVLASALSAPFPVSAASAASATTASPASAAASAVSLSASGEPSLVTSTSASAAASAWGLGPTLVHP
jgi:hypothetical protein